MSGNLMEISNICTILWINSVKRKHDYDLPYMQKKIQIYYLGYFGYFWPLYGYWGFIEFKYLQYFLIKREIRKEFRQKWLLVTSCIAISNYLGRFLQIFGQNKKMAKVYFSEL